MRRITLGLVTFLVLTATLLVVPVYAAPVPDTEPVAPSIEAVDLGSVAAPEDEAVVTADGEVLDAGPGADVTPDPAAPTSAPPTSAAPTAAALPEEVASSGDEVDGVPALTVSQPDTDPFSSVGVTWAQDAAVRGVTVQLRTKTAAGRWSDWTTVEADDVDPVAGDVDGTRVRSGTAPTWTGPSRGVEVIVQAADGTTPRDVQLQLIDPGTSDADALPGPPEAIAQADAAAAMPPIYSRAQWGADEALLTWGAEYAPAITAATVHHTADSNNYSEADVPRILRSIYAYHAVSRGWGDIGYNVIVDKFGRAWEGRAGGLASTVVGAHSGGFNQGTFGISMLGNYDLVDTPQALVDTVGSVIGWKLALYGVNPSGSTTLVSAGGGTSRTTAGTPVPVPRVFGHRDVGSTTCPGRYGYSSLGEIRDIATRAWQAAGSPTTAQRVEVAVPRYGLQPQVLLRNGRTSGMAEWTTLRGDRGDVPLACDWDGNGNETVGVFRAGRFYLFDSNDSAAAPTADFWFGDAGDVPLCGDWDGDGRDGIGIWRQGVFHLRNATGNGPPDHSFAYGNPDAQPVTGDWNGDGRDGVAVYQIGAFYWTDDLQRPVADGRMWFGDPGDRPVAGDWTGARRDSVGVFRGGRFFLAHTLGRPAADTSVFFGDGNDRPLVADWDGNKVTTVGVIRGY